MDDLNHWDFVDVFRPKEITSLILGVQPGAVPSSMNRAFIQIERKISEAFFRPMLAFKNEQLDINTTYVDFKFSDSDLKSTRVQELLDPSKLHSVEELTSFVWQLDDQNFEFESFHREEIARWISATGFKSTYEFESCSVGKLDLSSVDSKTYSENFDSSSIDPEDRPEELDVATIAWQTVRKGYGDQSKSFKSRLRQYLDEFYSHLSNEARDRIAIVANQDKKPGPKGTDY